MATIAVDVDDVCADLLTEWLRIYRKMSGHELYPEQIFAWELEKFVLPGFEKLVYSILQYPTLYDGVIPIPGALEAVLLFRARGHRVVFATSCPPGTAEHKYDWLVRHGFLEAGNRKDFVPITDKSLVRADFLFDDHIKNIETFPGKGVLINRVHNSRLRFSGPSIAGLHYAPHYIKFLETL